MKQINEFQVSIFNSQTASFTSTVRPTVHTNPSRSRVDGRRFKNGAFRQRYSQDNKVISFLK